MPYQQQDVVPMDKKHWLIDQAEVEFNHIISMVETDLNWEKEKAFALQYLMENEYLAKVAANNPVSLKQALLHLATSALTLNPVLKHAYLVPRDNKVVLDVGYLGLIHYATSRGFVKEVQAKIVYSHDRYVNRGFNQRPEHVYEAFGDRGVPLGCYVVARTATDGYLVEEMTEAEINSIRARSRSFQAFQRDNNKSTPWITDPLEMWRKTTVKRAFKYWITDNRFSAPEHIDSEYVPEQKIIPAISEQAQNLSIAIKDCSRIEELNEVASYIRDSGLGDYELSKLRTVWDQKRQQVLR